MNEIAVRNQGGIEDLKEQVRMVVNTQFVPEHLRGNPYACLAACLYGREIGLAPMESLSEVYMVDGRPALSAKAMVKLARRAGHRVTGAADDMEATVTGTRSDGSEMTVTFTMAEASRITRKGKKLTDGSNWQNYPSDMLWARAVSRLCRRLFSDVFGALPYGPDEMVFTGEGVAAVEDLPLVEPEPIPYVELREDKLRESTRDEPPDITDYDAPVSHADLAAVIERDTEPIPSDEQESLGSEFVRMAEEAQAKRMETGE